MTHHWQDTETGAELVVDGVVRARVMATPVGYRWDAESPTADGSGWAYAKQAAQAAVERALGLAVPVHDHCPEPARDPAFWGGLDLGEQAGWAVLDLAGERLASGLWDCSIRRGEGAGFRVIRMRRFLRELVEAYPGIAFGYELVEKHEVRLPGGRPRHNTYAAQTYGELRGAAAGLLDECGVPFAGVPVGVVKKRATGKGNAGKPAMVAAANERWGTAISEDGNDEADALWIALAAMEGLTA